MRQFGNGTEEVTLREKYSYYKENYTSLYDRKEKLENKIENLDEKKKEMLEERNEAYKDAAAVLYETSITLIQIVYNIQEGNFPVQDIAEFAADFDKSSYEAININRIIKDDINYIIEKTKVDIKILDSKKELNKTNKELADTYGNYNN